MSDTGRNRSEGWQYAKITGHENEAKIAELTMNDIEVQKKLLSCAHLDSSKIYISKIDFGGLCESDVECILPGGKTKSKTVDIYQCLYRQSELRGVRKRL